MKKSDKNRDVLALVGDIMRKFYEDNDFSSFAHYFSPDIVYIPLGNREPIVGSNNVTKTLKTSLAFECKIENEDYLVKELDNGVYLVSGRVNLSCKDFAGIKRIRADLVLKSDEESGSKILSIAFSKICEHHADTNVFPVERKSMKKDRGAQREEILIDFLLDGLGNREIAKRLSLAEITIKKALSKIYQRFEVKNRGELVAKISKKHKENK